MAKTLGQLLYGEEREAARLKMVAEREAARQAKTEARREASRERALERGAKEQTSMQKYMAAAAATVEFAGVRLHTDTKTITYRGYTGAVSAGTRATVESSGAIDRRMTLTRVGAGAILFGPAGAIVGGLAKKKLDHRSVYLTIEGDGYAWVIEMNAKDEQKARGFAAKVNATR